MNMECKQSKTENLTEEQSAILAGLIAEQKSINPKYFYDQNGSKLFDKITKLSEYYPTRTEIGIYKKYAKEIATYIESDAVIIEPGAGSCEKIQYLLPTIKPKAFVPQDVSGVYLKKVSESLMCKYPWLDIVPLISDFSKPLVIPQEFEADNKYIFYPGSTIGNFEPSDAVLFLKSMRAIVGNQGGIILGADLQKDIKVLEAAYNDEQGVTANFNLNILKNVSKHLGVNFDTQNFEHKAFYNVEAHRIEMHLRSIKRQSIDLFNYSISFEKDETIHTENSYKYTLDSLQKLVSTAGFTLKKTWLDDNKLFSVNLLSPSKD